ncbi:potassium/proton antiporter, partial [Pseudomonas sp. MWU13-2860]
LVARPLAVWLCMLPFPVPKAEKLFMRWVGLRGAVPVILAIFPLMAGLPNSQLFFNVAFFVVMMSLLFQGWTIAPLAEKLKLKLPARPDVEHRVPVVSGQQARYESASCLVRADSPAEGQLSGELALPAGLQLHALYREDLPLLPAASQTPRAGDGARPIGPSPS